MKQNLETIKEQLKYHLPRLKKDFSVEEIGIFGSVAQGRDKPKSDVDILVDFSRPPGFIGFMKLEEYLSQVLGKKVDLVTKNALKKLVKDEILHQLIYV
jgi:hypothetical protein